jgi:TetR/AcrR family transcriptional regulator, transcriptional repressor for nem operon
MMMTNLPVATAASILDAAESITQAVGYNGLSFRDIAAAVGIKSASVHYHFPSKGQLGAAVARRYTDRLVDHLDEVDSSGIDPKGAMDAYIRVFRNTLERDARMCLCGMLAAENGAIPEEVRAEVRRFVDLNVRWIAGFIERATGAPATSIAVQEHARAIFAALEGAMLIARGTGDMTSFDASAAQFRRAGLIPK